ncbi:CHAT domain-containing protein [Nakamurella silvestris]|nr:CHAT domain-containing protein [Nakamurella silvestris]
MTADAPEIVGGLDSAGDWRGVLARAKALSGEGGETLLAAICLAKLIICPPSNAMERSGDFPPGRPPKEAAREAGRLLLQLTEGVSGEQAKARRVLGYVSALNSPQNVATDEAPGGELGLRVRQLEQALDLAGEIGDPLIVAYCRYALGFSRQNVGDYLNAVNFTAEAGRESLEVLHSRGVVPGRLWLNDAPFLSDSPFPTDAHPLAVRLHAAVARSLVNRHLDMANPAEAKKTAVQALGDLVAIGKERDEYLRLLNVLTSAVHAQRDIQGFQEVELELKGIADSQPATSLAYRYWKSVAAENAGKLSDFGRAYELQKERVQARLLVDFDSAVEVGEVDVALIRGMERQYQKSEYQNGLTWIGNVAYEIASVLIRSGRAGENAAVREEALALVRVAEDAWRTFVVNGVHSVRMMRARLVMLSGDADAAWATSEFLAVNELALRHGTRSNALCDAVRLGEAGSPVVLARLESRIEETDPELSPAMYAKYLGWLAEWHLRRHVELHDKPDGGEAADRLRLMEGAAMAALGVLRPSGVSLDPAAEAAAWQAAAVAARTVGAGQAVELDRLLGVVRCAAEVMITISTAYDRGVTAARFGPFFSRAVQLAVELGDHASTDLIMEAARRDRVGLLLAELTRNPDVGDRRRSAALAIKESGSSVPAEPDSRRPEGEPGPPAPTDIRTRSAAIVVDREQAVRDAESVFGVLGALCDPRFLDDITAALLLRGRRTRAQATAVLQFLPTTAPALTAGRGEETVTVYRRLTWTTSEGGEREYLDQVEVSPDLVHALPGSAESFAWRTDFAAGLLPAPLLELLGAGAVGDPLRLLIVPTGFFHVPFDALPLASGLHLIDRAVVSLHGSLTSALSLMEAEVGAAVTPGVAVYDTRLAHTGAELAALMAHLIDVHEVSGARELALELRPGRVLPPSLLAMGLHGSRDDTGWGQTKTMPNDTTVNAAQALGWDAPNLCVMGSCHSSITTPDGVELGGFPLALMLGGATTVIGGLYAIDDAATSQIMIRFWELLAAGTAPINALREAKLRWLADTPGHRKRPRLWAGLTVYGASQH